MPALDHLRLTYTDRDLIRSAATDAETIYLRPLDKGLSGAMVLLVQWAMSNGGTSKFHVFKLNTYEKLRAEKEACRYAATVENGFPYVDLWGPVEDRGVLAQEFRGDATGEVLSLRQKLAHQETSANEAAEIVCNLYERRMHDWHRPDGTYQTKEVNYAVASDRWGSAPLDSAIDEIGRRGLDASLVDTFGVGLDRIVEVHEIIADTTDSFAWGPVHGDLHSQNVVLSNKGVELIDYARSAPRWRALDFLMMECSLKFLGAPPHARLEDLVRLEGVLEPTLSGREVDTTALDDRIYGAALAKTALAVAEIRRCALKANAVRDGEQYRRGLLMMTAGLAELPEPINRGFLFHSWAHHATIVELA